MRLIHRVLVGTLLIAGAVAVSGPASADGLSAPYDAFSFQGANENVATSAVTGFLSSGTLVVFASSGTASDVGTTIWPPTGQNLAVGTYALGNGPAADHAYMTLPGNCSTETSGTLNITQMDLDASNTLSDFAASYQVTCPTGGVYGGELRWHSNVGFKANTASSTYFDFGSSDFGFASAAKTVTITGAGSDPTTLGASTVGGPNAGDFAISADNCKGVSLAYGQTCTVSVVANVSDRGNLTANLVTPQDTAAGQSSVALVTYGHFGNRGTYFPVAPTRVLDTRIGLGAPKRALGANGVLHVQINGTYIQDGPEIPNSGVSAVVANVTVVGPTASSFLTVYPTGTARPNASSLNFPKGWTGANTVTVGVGTGGKIDIYNYVGATNVLVDIVGYYGGAGNTQGYIGGSYQPFSYPERMMDTRKKGIGALAAGWQITPYLDFGVDNPHVRAYAVNITAVSATGRGYLSVWNGFNGLPNASILNFKPGATVTNTAIVPVGSCAQLYAGCPDDPSITVYNGATSGSVQVIVDISGFYDDSTIPGGSRFVPITPKRIVDTRSKLGASAIGSGKTTAITPPASLLDENTTALSMNITAVRPTASTYLTLWPAGVEQPTVSNINPHVGQTVANGATTLLGLGRKFDVFNHLGTTNLIVDVGGVFEWFPYQAQIGDQLKSPFGASPTTSTRVTTPVAGVAAAVPAKH